MGKEFLNKVVVVTGATGGIGQACVRHYLQSGAKVAMVDLHLDNLVDVQTCMSMYGEVKGYETNLLDIESIEKTIDAILYDFGRIDVLVNVAGVMKVENSFKITSDGWDLMVDTNTKGSFFISKMVVEKFMKKQGGNVIYFSSAAAIRGFDGNMASPHYSASKSALLGLTKQLAVEWGKYDIRVNAVVPGGVLTPAMKKMNFDHSMFERIPLRCLAEPEDIANVVVFLSSNQAKMITGQGIVIDGGASIVGQ